jgi:hypothetical protein
MVGAFITQTALQVAAAKKAAKASEEGGRAQQAAFEANAQVAESQAEQFEFNAAQAEKDATATLEVGHAQESAFRTSVRQAIGTQRAGFAGQGVKLEGGGTVADVLGDTDTLGEVDALTIRKNAAREAEGLRFEAADLRRSAGIARKGAAANRIGGQYAAAAGRQGASIAKLNAASNIVAGGASLYNQRFGWSARAEAA